MCYQAPKSGPEWHPDLVAMGYRDPLPPPIPGIQATLAAVNPPEIHKFVQETDLAAINSAGEEGEPLLLLTVLDLSQWSRIFEVANTDLPNALGRLKELHASMQQILIRDEMELAEAKRNTTVVEVAIRHANNQAEDSGSSSQLKMPESGTFNHPFLANLVIDDAHKAALEDLQDAIMTTQIEREQETLVASGRHLAVPFVPARTIEDQMPAKDHRVWATGNVNSLAPILTSTWRIWGGLNKADLDEYKDAALHGRKLISNGENLVNAFALYGFDHSKCTVTNVKLHIKLEVPTAKDRRVKHPQEMWNVHRPYLRCACHPKSNNGCSGSFIWWDHGVWYMINHLEKIFPDDNFPTLKAKFIAFLIWIQGAGRTAVRCQLAFAQARSWMCTGAIQFAANPSGKILAELPDMPGPRQIERMLKPASFSVANPGTPSSAPPSKRQKLNLNTPPSSNRQMAGGGYNRGRGAYSRGRGYGTGRGNSNLHRRYNPPVQNSAFQYFNTTPWNDKIPVFRQSNGIDLGSASHSRPASNNTSPIIQEVTTSPIRGRMLSFEDE